MSRGIRLQIRKVENGWREANLAVGTDTCVCIASISAGACEHPGIFERWKQLMVDVVMCELKPHLPPGVVVDLIEVEAE